MNRATTASFDMMGFSLNGVEYIVTVRKEIGVLRRPFAASCWRWIVAPFLIRNVHRVQAVVVNDPKVLIKAHTFQMEPHASTFPAVTGKFGYGLISTPRA